MSSRHHHTTLAVILAAVAALGACHPQVSSLPPVTAELSDGAWPALGDDDDPELIYTHSHSLITRYLDTTDMITRDGGDDPARMAPLTTSAWFPIEQAAFSHYRREHLRTIGDTVFDSLVIQSVSESVTGAIHVDAIACVDASWVWLVPGDSPDPPEGLIEWLQGSDPDDEVSDDDHEQWSEYLDTVSPVPGEREAIVFWLVGETASSLAIDGTINWEGAHACHTTVID